MRKREVVTDRDERWKRVTSANEMSETWGTSGRSMRLRWFRDTVVRDVISLSYRYRVLGPNQ